MFYVLIAIYDDLTSIVGRFANAFRLLRSDESDASDAVFRRTALEVGDAVRSSVLSLISSAPAKNELFHYASTAQLLKCGKAIH